MTNQANMFGKWRKQGLGITPAQGQRLRAVTNNGHSIEGEMEGNGIRISDSNHWAHDPGEYINFSSIRKRTLEVWG